MLLSKRALPGLASEYFAAHGASGLISDSKVDVMRCLCCRADGTRQPGPPQWVKHAAPGEGPGILEIKCPFNKGNTATARPYDHAPFYYMPQVRMMRRFPECVDSG